MRAADHKSHKLVYFVLCALCMTLFMTRLESPVTWPAAVFFMGTVVAACKVGIHTGAAAQLERSND